MRMTRRTFLQAGAAAAAAPLVRPEPVAAALPRQRVLGRTQVRVSELGMGVMITPNPEIVRAALDAGVTYFDTARAYMGGRNEAILAEGLGARRKDVVVATKVGSYGKAASILASCDQSLAALKTEWIDVFQLHGVSSRAQVLSPECLEGMAALKKAGKIRFAGVTTHASMVEVIDAAIEAKVYDTVLTTFNFRQPPGLGEAVKRAADAGVGVIAMKIMTGGYRDAAVPGLNPFQGALRWVLRQPGVATTIPSLVSFEQLQQNLEAAAASFGARDALALELYAAAIEARHCRACGGCAGQCPRGADVPAIVRALMYREGYARPDLAAETLAAAAFPCAGCGGCTVRCRFGVLVPERVATAVRLSGPVHA